MNAQTQNQKSIANENVKIKSGNAQPEETFAPILVTAPQLSKILQIPEQGIRRLHRMGKIPVIDLGSHLKRYHLPSVLAALQARNVNRRSTTR